MRLKGTKLVFAAAAAVLAISACSDHKRTNSAAAAPAVGAGVVDADNTGRNVRDRDPAKLTPLDQSNSEQDLALTQRIRQGITSEDGMSMQARNVKVITQDLVVTLRGPVKTEQEKATIELLAKNAGATRIDNQLEIDRDATSGEKE